MFPMPAKEQEVIIRSIAYSGRPDWQDLLTKNADKMPLRKPLIDDFINGRRPTLQKLGLELGGAQAVYARAGGAMAAQETVAVIRGTLFTTDLAQAKMYHDNLAAGGEAQAKMAGDIAHDVLLGTKLLSTTENEFLGMDRWTNADNMDKFYADPMFQQGFGMLFMGPPMIEQFVRQPTWLTWGEMDAGDASNPYFFAVIRGHLKDPSTDVNHTTHDMIAGGGKAGAEMLGDVAHVVFLGRTDEREFLAIDIWKSDMNIEMLYTDPNFQMAFGQLFDAPPKLGIYLSTDWHQW
jgi:hypothetical protein